MKYSGRQASEIGGTGGGALQTEPYVSDVYISDINFGRGETAVHNAARLGEIFRIVEQRPTLTLSSNSAVFKRLSYIYW